MWNQRFWKHTIIKKQQQEHYVNLQMDQLCNQRTTQPMQMAWGIPIELYRNGWLGWIETLVRQISQGVAGKFISHHHRHSAWHRTQLWGVYESTGMTEMDRGTAAYWDAGVMAMGWATGSIYSRDPGVDIISSGTISHLVSSYHTMNYTPCLSNLSISRTLSEMSWIQAIAWILTAE